MEPQDQSDKAPQEGKPILGGFITLGGPKSEGPVTRWIEGKFDAAEEKLGATEEKVGKAQKWAERKAEEADKRPQARLARVPEREFQTLDEAVSFWQDQGFELKERAPDHAELRTPRSGFGVMWIVVPLAAIVSAGTLLIPMLAIFLAGIYLEQRGVVRLRVSDGRVLETRTVERAGFS